MRRYARWLTVHDIGYPLVGGFLLIYAFPHDPAVAAEIWAFGLLCYTTGRLVGVSHPI